MAEGHLLVRTSWAGTATFAVATTAAVFVEGSPRTVTAAIDVALFAVGCGAFLWAFYLGVLRSRQESIGVVGLYFLTGCSPPVVRRSLLAALTTQALVGLTSASLRPFTSLAFGVLVPVFGLGLCGLWAARHGEFPARPDRGQRA